MEATTTLLGGLPIARIGMAETADDFIRRALKARGRQERPFYSSSANGQVIALCARDRALQDLMMQSDQIHADGMPMVHFSRIYSSHPLSERVATTDLVHVVAERAQKTGVSFYFLGGEESINARAVDAMRLAYPDLVFAGRRNGFFKPEEEEEVLAGIRAAAPDILWVGLGFPLEQQFITRNIDRLRGVGVIKTAGGLFDFISGKNSRAPSWMQKAGLEWTYRTWLEPRRLLMRYLVTNPVAIHALLRHSD